MDDIRQWAFGICAAAIACGLAQMIMPKSGMQRIFNITSSVFFLGCLLSPIIFSPLTLDPAATEDMQRQIASRSENLSSAAQQRTLGSASEGIRLEAGRVLEEMGISDYKIYINVHDDGEGGISISECEVELHQNLFPRHEEIRAALMGRLGVNVLIGYQKE